MSTTTLTRTDTLPRVNLLPPEIAEAARFRSAQVVMGLAVGIAVVVVGGLTYLSAGEVSSAEQDVAAAQVQTTTLQQQVTTYAEVPKVQAQLDAANGQLTQAMGQEVRYSFILKDLSLSMPAGVWLTNVTALQQVDPGLQVKGAWGTPAIGALTFAGQSTTLPQVAGWLDSLARQPGYTDPYLNTAQLSTTMPGYQFNSSVGLTAKAQTNRYAAKAGS